MPKTWPSLQKMESRQVARLPLAARAVLAIISQFRTLVRAFRKPAKLIQWRKPTLLVAHNWGQAPIVNSTLSRLKEAAKTGRTPTRPQVRTRQRRTSWTRMSKRYSSRPWITFKMVTQAFPAKLTNWQRSQVSRNQGLSAATWVDGRARSTRDSY